MKFADIRNAAFVELNIAMGLFDVQVFVDVSTRKCVADNLRPKADKSVAFAKERRKRMEE